MKYGTEFFRIFLDILLFEKSQRLHTARLNFFILFCLGLLILTRRFEVVFQTFDKEFSFDFLRLVNKCIKVGKLLLSSHLPTTFYVASVITSIFYFVSRTRKNYFLLIYYLNFNLLVFFIFFLTTFEHRYHNVSLRPSIKIIFGAFVDSTKDISITLTFSERYFYNYYQLFLFWTVPSQSYFLTISHYHYHPTFFKNFF